MFSEKFGREVVTTEHARLRMLERKISDTLLLDLIETGEFRHKDEYRIWIAKCYPDRQDNMLCVAVAVEAALVVKTVMHYFSWEHKP